MKSASSPFVLEVPFLSVFTVICGGVRGLAVLDRKDQPNEGNISSPIDSGVAIGAV